MKRFQVLACEVCGVGDDRGINSLGLKGCVCGHKRYHCQCPENPYFAKPKSKAKPEPKRVADGFSLTASPKKRKRRERGRLKLDEDFYRRAGMENEALRCIDQREMKSMAKGQYNMFVGEEERNRLHRQYQEGFDVVGVFNEY